MEAPARLLVALEYRTLAPPTGRPVTESTSLPEIKPCVVWQIPAAAHNSSGRTTRNLETKVTTLKRSDRTAVVRCRLT